MCLTGSQLKSYLQIPCVFPVHLEIFPVQISEICDNSIYEADFKKIEQTHFPVSFSCVFSLTGNLFCHFPCFPCAVGTLG